MRYFAVVVFAFLSFSFLASAGVSLPFTASPADTLISVEGQLVFESVLLGYNYSRPLVVSVALPRESLDGLNASLVLIYVKVSTALEGNSSIYFVDETGASKVERFTLQCVVEKGACNSSSVLHRSLRVVFRLPENGAPYNDEIIVNYSLEPIAFSTQEQALAVKADLAELEARLDSLKEAALEGAGVNAGEFNAAAAGVGVIIQQAKNSVDALDIENASRLVGDARQKLADLPRFTATEPPGNSSLISGFATGGHQDNLFLWAGVLVLLTVASFVYFKWKAKKPKYPDYDKLWREGLADK